MQNHRLTSLSLCDWTLFSSKWTTALIQFYTGKCLIGTKIYIKCPLNACFDLFERAGFL